MKPWIVVTGSSGLIGIELVKRLAVDFEIAALDIKPPATNLLNDKVHFFQIDLGNPCAIEKFFEKNPRPIQGFVNLAAYYNFNNRPSIQNERLKSGLVPLAQAFIRLNLPSSCFIQASSMACLEPTLPLNSIASNAPSLARWEYPKFKKESEDILRKELAAENYVELVLAGVYTDYCELVPLYQFLNSHLRLKLQRWFYPGDGRQGLTYIHIDDACDAFCKQISRPASLRRLLVGESQATTYRDIAGIIDLQEFGFRLPKIRVPKWFASLGAFVISMLFKKSFYQPWMIKFATEHYEFDLTDTTLQLDWRPNYSLKNQLPKMVTLAKKNPQEWVRLNTNRPWHEGDWPQLIAISTLHTNK